MSTSEDLMTAWNWPWLAMRWGGEIAETMAGAQRVVAARLPIIGATFSDPLQADRRELGRMVSEKTAAFGASGRAASSAGDTVQRALALNVGAWTKMARGQPVWPGQWLKIAEHNLAAAAALAALPSAALAPIRARVVANDRRLRR